MIKQEDGRSIYNDAGIVISANGPYVIAILSTLDGDKHILMNDLVRTLDSIQAVM